LTISVDDELIRLARVRAIQQGTSLSAKVREFLQNYVNESDVQLQQQRKEATARLLAAYESATSLTEASVAAAGSGAGPRRSLREELYDDEFRARDRLPAGDGSPA
jgi:plasmid stability protein